MSSHWRARAITKLGLALLRCWQKLTGQELSFSCVLFCSPIRHQCCILLYRYCEKAFPKSSGYSLTASSAQRSPPLPPVLDFNCQKRHFDQTLDHFDRADQRSFKQTYWVCNDAWPQSAKKQVRMVQAVMNGLHQLVKQQYSHSKLHKAANEGLCTNALLFSSHVLS